MLRSRPLILGRRAGQYFLSARLATRSLVVPGSASCHPLLTAGCYRPLRPLLLRLPMPAPPSQSSRLRLPLSCSPQSARCRGTFAFSSRWASSVLEQWKEKYRSSQESRCKQNHVQPTKQWRMTSESNLGCKNGSFNNSSMSTTKSDLYNHVISNTLNASAKNQVGGHSKIICVLLF